MSRIIFGETSSGFTDSVLTFAAVCSASRSLESLLKE